VCHDPTDWVGKAAASARSRRRRRIQSINIDTGSKLMQRLRRVTEKAGRKEERKKGRKEDGWAAEDESITQDIIHFRFEFAPTNPIEKQ
jgi:hypothetical protein